MNVEIHYSKTVHISQRAARHWKIIQDLLETQSSLSLCEVIEGFPGEDRLSYQEAGWVLNQLSEKYPKANLICI